MKPKLTYADFVAAQKKEAKDTPYTVAWVLERYITEMNGSENVRGVKPLGSTHLYALRMLQRLPIGSKDARHLTKQDIIDHAKMRRETVLPATVNQDCTYLRGPLAYAPSAWDDCQDVSAGAIEAARPLLLKYNLIGKGTPRKRVPTDEEIQTLLADFAEQDKTSTIKMVPVVLFALASTRRRGEICRIQWGDIDWDRKDDQGRPTPMYMVRDLKHPTKKLGNHKWFPLFPELAEIIKRQPRLRPDDPTERVFPYNPVSVGAKYTRTKAKHGITNLRFHDNRRAAITRWLKVFSPFDVKQISGHETTVILERVYAAPNPADLHAKLPAQSSV